MVGVEFLVCAALLIYAASMLSRYSDVLAEKTGLGRVWIGAFLLASVTSLPELVTGVSAVAWLKAANMAAGAILGSCLFNVVLIAIMDLAYQPGPILAQAQEGHILSAGLGVLMLGAVAVGVLMGAIVTDVGIGGISLFSVLVIVLYVIGARLIGRFEQRRQIEVREAEAQVLHYERISRRQAYGMFVVSGIAVVILGIWLASIGDRLSIATGLSRSFVGNLFLAVSTSLPEVSASLAAVRIKAYDLAISNVLGSNLFNIAILFTYDLADGTANFWASLSNANALAAVFAIIMTSVVIISLIYRASPRTPWRIHWDGIALLGMYVGAMLVLYWLK